MMSSSRMRPLRRIGAPVSLVWAGRFGPESRCRGGCRTHVKGGLRRLDSTRAMSRPHRSPDPSPSSTVAAIVPPVLVSLMEAFRGFFTAPVWDHVLVLVAGVVLTPGKRTVSAALRIMGLSEASDFALYHHVLSQARWDSRVIARKLLTMILDQFLPVGALVIGIDDTIERRWGARIAARGIYRAPARSSHGHFVKATGR